MRRVNLLLSILALVSILGLIINLPEPTPLSKEEIAEIEAEFLKNTTFVTGHNYRSVETIIFEFPKENPFFFLARTYTEGRENGWKYADESFFPSVKISLEKHIGRMYNSQHYKELHDDFPSEIRWMDLKSEDTKDI